MSDHTTATPQETLIQRLHDQLASLVHTLVATLEGSTPTLAVLEAQVLRLTKDLGQSLLSGLAALVGPAVAPATVACSCGQRARYQRVRPAHILTLLGPITIQRPYYCCATCHQGQHPLDQHLAIAAGTRTAGLDEVLALLGVTLDSFAAAAEVLERLTLVHISPNTVRDATETLGTVLVAQQAAQQAAIHAPVPVLPPSPQPPTRLYLTMDGVTVHLHERGWSEVKVGCCYETATRSDRQRPDQVVIQAQHLSYTATLGNAAAFGELFWCEAARRGVLAAEEVIIIGDGAHWIWNLATDYFPEATQILDWYHASQYLWAAGTAIWGDQDARRTIWVQEHLDRLWEGEVDGVLTTLGAYAEVGGAVATARTYYTTHQARMQDAAFRRRGLHIGSGSIESGCKQVVSARLKAAGMIWDEPGAEAVVTVRAWLKSDRWEEAMALRPVPRRQARVRGKGAAAGAANPCGTAPAAEERPAEPPPDPVVAAAIMQVQAEQRHHPHPWKQPWSPKQRERARTARIPPIAVA